MACIASKQRPRVRGWMRRGGGREDGIHPEGGRAEERLSGWGGGGGLCGQWGGKETIVRG